MLGGVGGGGGDLSLGVGDPRFSTLSMKRSPALLLKIVWYLTWSGVALQSEPWFWTMCDSYNHHAYAKSEQDEKFWTSVSRWFHDDWRIIIPGFTIADLKYEQKFGHSIKS